MASTTFTTFRNARENVSTGKPHAQSFVSHKVFTDHKFVEKYPRSCQDFGTLDPGLGRTFAHFHAVPITRSKTKPAI